MIKKFLSWFFKRKKDIKVVNPFDERDILKYLDSPEGESQVYKYIKSNYNGL
jgi:hypothetical protein